jgi:tRNA nucleotidyltransferase (CCA-adding enzyme)
MTKVIKKIELFLIKNLFIEENPSLLLKTLKLDGDLTFIPELNALSSTPQDPLFHPEGDVFTHTLMVLDKAVELSKDLSEIDRKSLLLSAIFHDIAKPVTTIYYNGRIRSPKHDSLGEKITERILRKLKFDELIIKKVCSLIKFHLISTHFYRNKDEIKAKSIRKIINNVDIDFLLLLAEADYQGRNIDENEKLNGSPAVKWLKSKISAL